ncbi:MAG TPA: hypothetical protein VES00_19725 [Burkholderiaceae bacterium]|nr:hypothetical protein [Burkholderiaceae bacterium]
MAATLQALVSALEDDPYCGTRPPHWPGGPLRLGTIQEIIASRVAQFEINPQPLPPGDRAAAADVFQQVRLYQLGKSLQARGGAAGEMGGQISGFAAEMFDGTCGSVPLSVLIAWLLHHNPPPPPPWWLEEISQVASQLNLATRMEGNVGGAIQHAALATLKEQLGALRTQKAQAAR